MQSLSCALTLALAGVFGQHIREVRRESGQDSELQAALWLMKVRLNTIWLSFYTVLIIAGIALLLQSLL